MSRPIGFALTNENYHKFVQVFSIVRRICMKTLVHICIQQNDLTSKATVQQGPANWKFWKINFCIKECFDHELQRLTFTAVSINIFLLHI